MAVKEGLVIMGRCLMIASTARCGKKNCLCKPKNRKLRIGLYVGLAKFNEMAEGRRLCPYHKIWWSLRTHIAFAEIRCNLHQFWPQYLYIRSRLYLHGRMPFPRRIAHLGNWHQRLLPRFAFDSIRIMQDKFRPMATKRFPPLFVYSTSKARRKIGSGHSDNDVQSRLSVRDSSEWLIPCNVLLHPVCVPFRMELHPSQWSAFYIFQSSWDVRENLEALGLGNILLAHLLNQAGRLHK